MPRQLVTTRSRATNRNLVTQSPNSLKFNGTSTKILPATPFTGLAFNSALSGSGWFKVASLASNRDIFSQQEIGSPFRGFEFMILSTGKVQIEYLTVNSSNMFRAATTNTVVSVGVWVHLAFTYSNSTLQVWVNGVAQAITVSISNLTSSYATGALFFVGIRDGTANAFSGNMRNLQVYYNYAFTQTDVNKLLAGNAIAQTPTLNYLLNEGAGAISKDTSGNANNGAITAPTWLTDGPNAGRDRATARTLVP